MLFISAVPAERVAGTNMVRSYPAREHVTKPRVLAPASLDHARQAFAACRDAARATGMPAYVRAFWQPSGQIGGPKRAPTGLKAAIDKGEFRTYVNL